ncbi:MAG TPA: hypothetical protein VMW16_08635 [Sedimentisphaerales bacterium]|nr:hypothetical protein [Sedimentisphaerales bacterium]
MEHEGVIKSNRKWHAVNAEAVQKQLESDEFIHKGTCGEGLPIHTFRIVGEQLEGRLRPCKAFDRADRARTAEIWYHNGTGKEQGVAIRLSKMLWQVISEHHLFGRWIRITYKGSVRGKFPNSMKVYLVEADTGTITEQFERVETNGDRKNRKPRKPKQIRRPATAAVTA